MRSIETLKTLTCNTIGSCNIAPRSSRMDPWNVGQVKNQHSCNPHDKALRFQSLLNFESKCVFRNWFQSWWKLCCKSQVQNHLFYYCTSIFDAVLLYNISIHLFVPKITLVIGIEWSHEKEGFDISRATFCHDFSPPGKRRRSDAKSHSKWPSLSKLKSQCWRLPLHVPEYLR